MGNRLSNRHPKPNPYAGIDASEHLRDMPQPQAPTEMPRSRTVPRPPSPAKHLKARLMRKYMSVKPSGGVIQMGDAKTVELDKNFGLSNKFPSLFEVGEEIGRGHFGYTCSAVAKKGELKGLNVAVKIIPKSKITTSIAIEDVRREVKILQSLTGHPNIAQFYGAFEDIENVYIVLELCKGGELLDMMLSRGGKCSEKDAKAVIIQILKAVAFLHLHGVVHSDIKLENFLFTSEDENSRLKAIDFGLSDFIRPDEKLTDIVGSAYYAAPEVLHQSYDTGADVWSAGHPWLQKHVKTTVPLDILIFRLMKTYMQSSYLRKAALRALPKTLSVDELSYLKEQFAMMYPDEKEGITLETIKMALIKNATGATKSHIADLLQPLNALQYRRIYFGEFCAATLSIPHLKALDSWKDRTQSAYEIFEQSGNRAIAIQELASELGLSPSMSVHDVLQEWVRQNDGKLTFLGFVKLLCGQSTKID